MNCSGEVVWGQYKPGLWTVEWTVDSVMDLIFGLEFWSLGVNRHIQITLVLFLGGVLWLKQPISSCSMVSTLHQGWSGLRQRLNGVVEYWCMNYGTWLPGIHQ